MFRLAPLRRRDARTATLLDASSFEEAGVGGVLLDVGGLALFRGIDFSLVGRSGVFVHFGVVTAPLMAAIGGRNGRHRIVARHGNPLSLATRYFPAAAAGNARLAQDWLYERRAVVKRASRTVAPVSPSRKQDALKLGQICREQIPSTGPTGSRSPFAKATVSFAPTWGAKPGRATTATPNMPNIARAERDLIILRLLTGWCPIPLRSGIN
jgi:hypothetical protein